MKRVSQLFKNIKTNTSSVVVMTITYILVASLVLYPLATLLLNSFGITNRRFSPTIESYVRVLTDVSNWVALKNTLHIGIATTILAVIIGSVLAWIVTRTDFKYKGFIKFNAFLTLCIPSYVYAIAWIDLFRRNGRVHQFLGSIFTNYEHSLSAYSLNAVIIVLSINLYPVVFMAVSHALKNTNKSLEEAAMNSGASQTRTTLTITLPLVTPTILAIGLFVFSRVIANFGVVSALASPRRIEVLTTRVFSALSNFQMQLATSLSVLLLIISALVFYSHKRISKRKKFVTISSSSSKPALIELKKSKIYVTIAVFSFHILTAIIPFITLLLTSLMSRSHLPWAINDMSLNNYLHILKNPMTIRAFSNSIMFGFAAASIAVIISLGIIFVIYKLKSRGHRAIEVISSLPMAMPGVVIGIAAILAWSSFIVPVYGTPWIIILAYIAFFIPITLKILVGTVENQDVSLEDAAQNCGASKVKAFKDITLPLLRNGIISAGLMAFIIALREIPISLLLFSKGNETVGILMFVARSDFIGAEYVSAISVIVILITIGLRTILIKVIGKKNSKKNEAMEGYYVSSN